MHIVYFHQYFCTPDGAWSTRAYELSRRWVELGHDVTVVTGIYYKSDMTAHGVSTTRWYKGVRVITLNVPMTNKSSAWRRCLRFAQYSILSSIYAVRLRADVVIASVGPLTAVIPALVAKYVHGSAFVYESRDLWVDMVIQLRIVKSPSIVRVLYAFERYCCRTAKLVVALSPDQARVLSARSTTPTISVTNISDNELFGRQIHNWTLPEWAREKKLAVYCGNIGHTNNSGFLFDVARALETRGVSDIVIVIIGDGQLSATLAAVAQREGLATLQIIEILPKRQMALWLQRAMCALLVLQDLPVMDTASPNKLFDALAAGVPLVQTTNGWIRHMLEEYECGFTVSASDAGSFADILQHLAAHLEMTKVAGGNGKRLARTHFDKRQLADKFLVEMIHCIDRRPGLPGRGRR